MGDDVEDARRAGLGEGGQTDEDVAQRLIREHLLEYFEASEEQRAEVSRDIEEAEARGEDLVAAHLPWGEWLHKWPLAARNAIRALWRTPKDQ